MHVLWCNSVFPILQTMLSWVSVWCPELLFHAGFEIQEITVRKL